MIHKLTALSAAIVVCLTGCQSIPMSKTWETVKSVPHVDPEVKNRPEAYAEKLHQTFRQAGVEHKIVKFRFKYPGLLRADVSGEDVAVIYKDPAMSAHPWWIMSDCQWRPVWLPTEAIERQVAFYLRRPATILSVTSFPAGEQKASVKTKQRTAPAGRRR